ncbi:MAG: hypothetical protein JW787_12020 [Sedimentisphaerales bacterium]|nr:hypothetical protein [Sedimentisphaerales bacterium]
MNYDNPLLPIWEFYQITGDCLKVAQRTINRENEYFMRDTGFIGKSIEDATDKIVKSRRETEDYVVLSLWIAFERFMFNHVQEAGSILLEKHPLSFSQKLFDKLTDAVEYWKVEDVLDMFKNGMVSTQLIGDAKNIKKYRDWIAHKNPKKATPSKVTPETAYKILSTLMYEIQNLFSLEKT